MNRQQPPRAKAGRRGSVALSLAMSLAASTLATFPSPRPSPTAAADWYVDANAASCAAGNGTAGAPFCTIMEAIVAAADGDTVRIGPGTYVEQLIVYKDLTLIGTEGDEVTIVQGPGGRVVRPWSATTVTIDGLTITGGSGYSKGTGLFLGRFPNPPTVTLTNSTVSGNRSRSTYRPTLGGGVYVGGGTLTISHSTITDNRSYGYDYGVGGGVHLEDGTLTIQDSTVFDNTASSAQRAHGGGISVRGGALTVERSRIERNSAWALLDGPAPPPPLGISVGGGVACVGGATVLRNTTVIGNTVFGTYEIGSGVAAYSGFVLLEGCTVTRNGGLGGSAAVYARTSFTVRDSIVWQNTGGEVQGGFTQPVIEFSDVEGGWPGQGNLSLDPGFVDPSNGDYSLAPGSPCIDAGDPTAAPTGLDLGGNPRLLDGDLDRAMRADMGAFEFDNVRLTVTGPTTPGGTLTLSVTGTPGMSLRIAGGYPSNGTLLMPWGSIFYDLTRPFRLFSFGTSPNVGTLPIPPSATGPLDVVLQALGFQPLSTGKSAGNVSNPVFFTIE